MQAVPSQDYAFPTTCSVTEPITDATLHQTP